MTTEDGPTAPPGEDRPLLRVVTPDATAEEVAAIVAVVSALGGVRGPGRESRRRPESVWNSPYRQVRPFYSHGPGGWRSSGLPKHRGRGN